MSENHAYDDILDLPHPESKKHPRMSRIARGAQFSPFAALQGYDDLIDETARFTERRTDLGESEQETLNMRFGFLLERIGEHPEVTVTFFESDAKKEGGAYRTKTGRLIRYNEFERLLVFEDRKTVSVDEIVGINGELFGGFDW